MDAIFRNHLSEQDFFELATIFGVIWTVSVLSFVYADNLDIQPFIMPAFLIIIMLLFMINPTRLALVNSPQKQSE